jgi:hypothetical protein
VQHDPTFRSAAYSAHRIRFAPNNSWASSGQANAHFYRPNLGSVELTIISDCGKLEKNK